MTRALTVDMSAIQQLSSDPFAFMAGFSRGFQKGTRADVHNHELAYEYLRGHALGRRVQRGEEAMPEWAAVRGDLVAATTINLEDDCV